MNPLSQQDHIDSLARRFGRVMVRHGYLDQSVRVVCESGIIYRVPEEGSPHFAGYDTTGQWLDFIRDAERSFDG